MDETEVRNTNTNRGGQDTPSIDAPVTRPQIFRKEKDKHFLVASTRLELERRKKA